MHTYKLKILISKLTFSSAETPSRSSLACGAVLLHRRNKVWTIPLQNVVKKLLIELAIHCFAGDCTNRFAYTWYIDETFLWTTYFERIPGLVEEYGGSNEVSWLGSREYLWEWSGIDRVLFFWKFSSLFWVFSQKRFTSMYPWYPGRGSPYVPKMYPRFGTLCPHYVWVKKGTFLCTFWVHVQISVFSL